MEVKRGTAFRAPLRFLDTNGIPVTGQSFSGVTCYIQKQAGNSTQKVLTSGDWFEIDPVNFPGVYDLLLSPADTDTVGFLKYSVIAAGSNMYVGFVGINRNTAGDVVDLLGVPLKTIARDILEIGNIVTTMGRHWKSRK
jgi:hypothetical protein